MLSLEFDTSGTDTGLCVVSSVYGAVCLLENGTNDGIDTYRASKTDWDALDPENITEAALATAAKAVTNALQDKTSSSKLNWMDYFDCQKVGTTWTCSAFQPSTSNVS